VSPLICDPTLVKPLSQVKRNGARTRTADARMSASAPPQLKLLSQFAGPTSKHLVSVDHHE
jgi:hypothetical protein